MANKIQTRILRERNPSFNQQMLTLARDLRGYSKVELASRIGVTAGFVTQLEDGLKTPSEETLQKISLVTDFPVSHFFLQGRYEAVPTSMFRKRKTVPTSILNTVAARITFIKRIFRTMLSEVDAPSHTLPLLEICETPGGIPAIAAMVRAAMRIPDGPINNLIGVLEEYGVFVIPFDFGTLKIDGCSDWVDNHPIILFNPNMPKSRIRHTLAHELGHLVMHQHILDDSQDVEADAFAANFTMPKNQILSQLIPMSLQRLASLKAHWKSSMGAILYRASDLSVITERQSRYLWMQLRKASSLGDEPNEHLIPFEHPQMYKDLIEAFWESVNSDQESIPEFFHINPSLFNNLLPMNGFLRAV